MSTRDPAVDDLICAALRGEKPSWALSQDVATVEAFLRGATHHGVQVLLHAQSPGLDWPSAVRDALRRHAMAWAVWEHGHRKMLVESLEALAARGIHPVLFKGTALAYSVYAEPYLRPRSDTDLLIAADDRQRAAQVLEALGFARSGTVDCEYVSYEAGFTRQEAGLDQVIDLHWRIHYSQLQAQRFPYAMLRQSAQPLPRLSDHAFGASPVHAVLLGCVHRSNDMVVPQWSAAQVRFGSDRLIWIHDIHLLIERMTPAEQDELAHLAAATGVRKLVREPVGLAIRHFGTRGAESLFRALEGADAADTVTRYQGQSAFRQKWADFSALPGAKAKTAFLLEHLAPPPAYMRERYPGSGSTPVIVLRTRRLMDGVRRRLGPSNERVRSP